MPLTKPKGAWQWSYLDSKSMTRRQVLIGDISFQSRFFSIIEFEQRQNDKCRLGMVCRYNGLYIPSAYIALLMTNISRERGIWSNIPDDKHRLLIVNSYKHVWSSHKAASISIINKVMKYMSIFNRSSWVRHLSTYVRTRNSDNPKNQADESSN